MPNKKRPSRKIKQRSIRTHDWHRMTLSEKSVHQPVGGVSHVTGNSRAGNGMSDTYRLEWGVRNKNIGTMVVHGTAEQARALLSYAHAQLRPNETLVDKETMQALLQSFCSVERHPQNKMTMWIITKSIPGAGTQPTQYQRAHIFLRSLLVRTLRNIYESATGEKIA